VAPSEHAAVVPDLAGDSEDQACPPVAEVRRPVALTESRRLSKVRQGALGAVLVADVVATCGSGAVTAAVPAAPTPLAPTNGAQVTVPSTISWSGVTDPSGIIAYNRQVSPSSTMSPVIEHGSTSGQAQATVSGLVEGTYFWRVQAVNGAFVQGAGSAPQSFTVSGANARSPGSATLEPPSGGTQFHPLETLSFTWSAVADAASYIFEASNDPNFPVATRVHFDNIPNTNYSLTLGDSMPQGAWYVRVQAVNVNGIPGVPSNTVTFTLSFNAPLVPPPALLSPANGTTVALPVTFTWTDVPNPQLSGYTLEIAPNPGFTTLDYLNNQITGPHWTVTSLTAGTKYWRVNSTQGDAAPGVPAVAAWSSTGSFIVPSTPTLGSLAHGSMPPPPGPVRVEPGRAPRRRSE
jgi:hypothetical protein